MAHYLKRPSQPPSTTVHIKFVPPVSGLPSSVEVQTRCASTSVVFTPGLQRCILTPSTGLHMLHTRYRSSWNIWMCSFKVYGKWSVDSCTHTHTRTGAQSSHASVGLAQAHPNDPKDFIYFTLAVSGMPSADEMLHSVSNLILCLRCIIFIAQDCREQKKNNDFCQRWHVWGHLKLRS